MYPILMSIPHAGLDIPDIVKDKLVLLDSDLKDSCDLYADRIYKIPNVHLIEFEQSRQIIDPNRFLMPNIGDNKSSSEGICPHITQKGIDNYSESLTNDEIRHLINNYYFPFHRDFDYIIRKNDIKFIIDGHAMASRGPKVYKDAGVKRSEMILGNRDYSTCTPQQTEVVRSFFEKNGFQVAINDPYKGKAIMEQHCYKDAIPGIQIEFNKSLYVDEATFEPLEGKIEHLNGLIGELVELIAQDDKNFKLN